MYRRMFIVLAALAVGASSLPVGASSAGGMGIPSSGTIGSTGLFLSCRTSSASSATNYYDQQDRLRIWDCGDGRRPHKGVDILGPSASVAANPVYAAAAGAVWTVERGNGLGWRVVLRHGRDVGGNSKWTYTIYGHMGDCSTGTALIRSRIVPGAVVRAGELLGYQGNDSYPSGCASRVHLHWEVRAATSDVSNVFTAVPASPNYYTGVKLTADDPRPARQVTATAAPLPTASPPPDNDPRWRRSRFQT